LLSLEKNLLNCLGTLKNALEKSPARHLDNLKKALKDMALFKK